MSNSIIQRAIKRLVRSEEFLELFTDHLMLHLEQQLRHEAAGDRVYIPKAGDMEHKEARDEKIRARFKGNNLKELAAEFHLSEKQIRRICCPGKKTLGD